jgi:hypothetical protein
MSEILTVLVVVLTLSQILLYGALAEAYRDIRQLRLHVGAVDDSLPVDLGSVAGGRPSAHALPAALDSVTSGLVLLVDRRCSTCNLLVDYFAGQVPTGVWLVALADDETSGREWLRDAGFAVDACEPAAIAIARPDDIREALGVSVTPLAVTIRHGRLAQADTVPSVRRFLEMLAVSAPVKAQPISRVEVVS